VSKVYTAVWLVVCVAALTIIQLYAVQLGWWPIALYGIVFTILPLLWILRKLFKARVAEDYKQLSTQIKFVMLAGILSMLFFIF